MRLNVKRRGVKLFEVAIVLAVLFVLLLLLSQALFQSGRRSTVMVCVNNLKKLGTAMHAIHDMHGELPPLAAATNSDDLSTHEGPYRTRNRGYTLFVWVLPFVDSPAPPSLQPEKLD